MRGDSCPRVGEQPIDIGIEISQVIDRVDIGVLLQ
jgi:hypothetical protein